MRRFGASCGYGRLPELARDAARLAARATGEAVPHPLLSDPFVAQEIDRALEPYAEALAPDELAWARERLAELLEQDDGARSLLDAAYPRTVERSGEQLRPTATVGQHEPKDRSGSENDGTHGASR